jgi:beta-lactamase class A
VSFERGVVPAQISLDNEGRIQGLFFRPPQPKAALAPEQLLAEYRKLPGEVSVLVLEGPQERLSLNADRALAVGSSFKLAVLEALRQQIEAGQRRWSDTVPLRPEWKSLPSGTLQNLPDGTSLSLEQYATQMISISDNTATDALISIVGRAEVEKLAPRNRPFLTTREAFVLKNPQNREWLERYRANPAERAALLPQLARLPLPDVSVFAGGPVALDVEWFFSTRELCTLMGRVQALPLMSLNPGLANPADWQRVAYKGGSEPGVLNLTTWLTAKDGRQYCVSATWNNPQARLDENQFFLLYTSLLNSLK